MGIISDMMIECEEAYDTMRDNMTAIDRYILLEQTFPSLDEKEAFQARYFDARWNTRQSWEHEYFIFLIQIQSKRNRIYTRISSVVQFTINDVLNDGEDLDIHRVY